MCKCLDSLDLADLISATYRLLVGEKRNVSKDALAVVGCGVGVFARDSVIFEDPRDNGYL